MKRKRIDVLCLKETRRKVFKAREIGEGIKFFYYGMETRKNGVAIAVAGTLKEHVFTVNRVSDRLISVRITTGEGFWNVTSVYAPQCGCAEAEKMAFYDELDEVIRGAPESDYLKIGGDFNGHVGQDRKGFERVHGGRGFGIRNQDGERIVDMAEAHDLAITSTFLMKRDSQKVTIAVAVRKARLATFWSEEMLSKRLRMSNLSREKNLQTKRRYHGLLKLQRYKANCTYYERLLDSRLRDMVEIAADFYPREIND
ncbi:hypothetical protein ANCCEY_07783 [Ancylostoma ceylanicum]|uniref:Endonuclease/exonuclease/phosphatase domain-containing protein n=1 Tax=Ancylostoma ceylanicum TaxID=53326 RepID=A0A0D6LPJ1_9BILA|nr:hypothetical protein ANCCEY_07783 [Ancylostoma ceylanicum]